MKVRTYRSILGFPIDLCDLCRPAAARPGIRLSHDWTEKPQPRLHIGECENEECAAPGASERRYARQ